MPPRTPNPEWGDGGADDGCGATRGSAQAQRRNVAPGGAQRNPGVGCPPGPQTPNGVAENAATGHSYTNLLYHIVFATKDCRPLLEPPTATRLHAYLGGGIRQEGGTALIVNGTSDHVHILTRLREDKALSDVIRSIKANASKWIHQTFSSQQSFASQTGYGAFTVSESQVQKVRRYIAEQELHHRERTFDEALAALLRAHGTSPDANHL